jgi:hypothetical protein
LQNIDAQKNGQTPLGKQTKNAHTSNKPNSSFATSDIRYAVSVTGSKLDLKLKG